jgi:S1-C subfamily serine protease
MTNPERNDEPTTAYRWTSAGAAELPLHDGPVWDPRTGEWIERTTQRAPADAGRGTRRSLIAAAVVGAVVSAAVAFPVARLTAHPTPAIEQRVLSAPPAVAGATTKGGASVVAIAAKARPWVVNIDVSSSQQTLFGSVPVAGTGSGVIIRSDGYILTNAHVVNGASSITVTLADGSKLTGHAVGIDTDTDIAVVKVDRTGLPAAVLGSVKNIQVGELAVAIGSPLGLDQTVTAGIISALGRSVDRPNQPPLVDMVQTDAPITEGNSGGALVDATGSVVGINAAIATAPDVGGTGIGFAIPIDIATAVARQLIASGHATHPWLGVSGEAITSTTAQQFKVSQGAFIVAVTKGGPADRAGMKANDVVVSFNGHPITSMDDLVVAIREQQVGDHVTIGVIRGGKRLTLNLVIGNKPAGP